jgi:hypothetical protein
MGFRFSGNKTLTLETCVSKTGLPRTTKVQFMYSQDPLFLITRPPTPSQIQSEARPGVNKSRDTRSPGPISVLPRRIILLALSMEPTACHPSCAQNFEVETRFLENL